MELDQPRRELLRLIAEEDADLSNLSKKVGRNHAYLHQYVKQGKPRVLPEEVRERLGKLFNVDPAVFRAASQMRGMRAINLGQAEDTDIGSATTPVLEVETYIGMGGGGLMEDARVIARWQLPTEWLRTEIRSSNVAQVFIVTLEGDSMEGTLAPGDKVIVDLGRRVPSPPGLFVIFDGLAQVAKRLYYLEGTDPAMVRVISDNAHYGPYERALSEMSIVGRIMGRWQRLS